MADLHLQHETIDQAFEELVQAGNQMRDHLEALLQGLQDVKTHFHGRAAEAFHEFHRVAHENDREMHQLLHRGAQILEQMHDSHKRGDAHAASLY